MRAAKALSGWWLVFVLGWAAVSAPLAVRAQPVAVDDSYATESLQGLTVDAATACSPTTRQAMTMSSKPCSSPRPPNGTLLLDCRRRLLLHASTGFTGSDTFTYQATNGRSSATSRR